MKKHLIIFTLLTSSLALAQQPLSTTNCDITLTVQAESGTNGVAVAYNPKNNLYYTVFAGNTLYPLETHSSGGTSTATQEVGYDVRGMWYNPSKKCLEGITYNNQGSFEVRLNSDGSVSGTVAKSFSYGMGAQTVGTYAEKKKSVMFVEGTTVYFFKPETTKSTTLELKPSSNVILNTNGPMYTGVRNYEIGLLEPATMTVHLFSAGNGKETGKVKLNGSSCNSMTEGPSSFRVSYCNGHVFLFDTKERTWTGYKLF